MMTKRRSVGLYGLLLSASWTAIAPPNSVSAAGPSDAMQVERDIAYTEPANTRQMLDVYHRPSLKTAPTIVYIHGGGWRKGDKGGMERKAEAFLTEGYLFVSTTYRFFPDVNIHDMTKDVAGAIGWTHKNAAKYGGDPERIIVMGHSAGAHLAALVCTDERFLGSEGVPLSTIKACVPLDGGAYDIPHRVAVDKEVKEVYKEVFGSSDATYREYSPGLHLAKGKGIPPFLIFYVAGREATKLQTERFAEQLKAVGVEAQVSAAKDKTHATLESELGLAGDKPTEETIAFLKKHCPAATAP